MKTYPYMDGDQLIELVEQREYDEILKLSLQLANLRAEDMATIKEQAVMIEKLANALTLITEEYEDRRFQFGDDRLWQKDEGVNPLPTAFAALDAYELKRVKLKQALLVAGELEKSAKRELQEAVTRMEAVPVQELDKIWDDAPGGSALVGFEAVRTRLIQAAKGEQP